MFTKKFCQAVTGFALVAGVTGALAACSSHDDDASSEAAQVSERDAKLGPALFRNVFYTYMKQLRSQNGGNVDEAALQKEVQELVYMPTDEVLTPPKPAAWNSLQSNEKLFALDDVFKVKDGKGIKPSDLYKNGAPDVHPFEDMKAEELEKVLAAHPMHIVIVPGIFSETIPLTPFEELFSADSAAKRAFKGPGAEISDKRLVVRNVEWDPKVGRYVATEKDTPLIGSEKEIVNGKWTGNYNDPLVRVGSIDSKDGKPLVTVTYLKANTGSLEDFGTNDKDTETYLHRLDAYFKAADKAGFPKDVYLMGYSRGAVTGLDLLVQAKAQAGTHPWANNIKGFLSHAGVIYGSQLADASFSYDQSGHPTTSGTELVNVLKAFVGDKPSDVEVTMDTSLLDRALAALNIPQNIKDALPIKDMPKGGPAGHKMVRVLPLESCQDPSPGTALRNKTINWPGFLALAGMINMRTPKHPEIAAEGIDARLPDLGRLSTFVAMNLGIPLPGAQYSDVRGFVNLGVNPFEIGLDLNHCKNVESFKIAARSIIEGAESLTTKSRLEWHYKNALPEGVKYFALTGTMGDATDGQMWDLTKNTKAFDPGSIDFKSLRGNYYDFLAASGGIQVQDSQVSVERGRFWPELHTGRGFRTANVDAYFMGTMGTHHWGLAFPRAFSANEGSWAKRLDQFPNCPTNRSGWDMFKSCGNPYPRTVLLKSIATFVAQAEAGGVAAASAPAPGPSGSAPNPSQPVTPPTGPVPDNN